MPREKKKKFPTIFLSGVALTLTLSFFYVYKPLYFQFLDRKLYDVFCRHIKAPQRTKVPVIVDLDEKSLLKFGQWPWPRYRVALLLEKIKEAGAAAVGIDILFAEPDRTSLQSLQSEMERDLNVRIELPDLPDDLLDNDRRLAAVLATGPFVLGFYFEEEASRKSQADLDDALVLNPVIIKAPAAREASSSLFSGAGIIPPLPIFVDAAAGLGFINSSPDEDGITRRVPLLMSLQKKIYPNMALETIRVAKGYPGSAVKVTASGLESLRLGETIIPLDKNGRMQIYFRGPAKSFPYFSAADVLTGDLPAGSLAGKIVFMGSSAAGLKDLIATPLDPKFPGMEVHATVVENILSGLFFIEPDWKPGMEFCLLLVLGLVTALCVVRTNLLWTTPLALLAGSTVWYGSRLALTKLHIFISPLFPLLALCLNFFVLSLIKFRAAEKEKQFLRNAFSQYVSSSIVDRIVASPSMPGLDGEEKNMTILFSDIRDFTTLSERLSPTQVSDLLHEYFTPMTRIVIRNQGTLDKFIGDALMAFWNAPAKVSNHKQLGIRSAMEMLEHLRILNTKFVQQFGLEIAIGIGIHSGNVRVGNMGSKDLFDYTLIGDNVNITSRLEGLNKLYGTQIIISESMRSACPEGYLLQELDVTTVKGNQRPLRIYTLRAIDERGNTELELARYGRGLDLYRRKKFQEALEIFAVLKRQYQANKLYTMYHERCLNCIRNRGRKTEVG